MEQFIISLISLAIIAAVIHFGGLVGVFSFLALLWVIHIIYHKITGHWMDE